MQSKARGRRDRPSPRRAKLAEHETGAEDADDPPETALPAPCTRTARSACATPTCRGGGACTPREHERTHTQ